MFVIYYVYKPSKHFPYFFQTVKTKKATAKPIQNMATYIGMLKFPCSIPSFVLVSSPPVG